jgi:protein-tyrosine-phosphatase
LNFGNKRGKNSKKTVLFVCVQNAGRSQIAEGLFRKYAPEGYEAISAGTEPSGNLNPHAIQVMNEIGIDITKQKPKIITDQMIRNSTVRVNMGCIERKSCPTLFINDVIDWDIDDPRGKSIEQVRQIRNTIDLKVKEIVTTLAQNSAQINH